MTVELKEGMPAPEIAAPSRSGTTVRLRDLRGRKIVLYFYPKDDTAGCTKEACAFQDRSAEFADLGAVVYGASRDDLESHEKFARKYGLEFPLLSDPDGKLVERYGVWKEKTLYGRKSMGIERTTFLIDEQGTIRKIWRKVQVDGHVDRVLEALRES